MNMNKDALHRPSSKLGALLKEFEHIAAVSGFVNHVFDPPQMRMMFTLYGRVSLDRLEDAIRAVPLLKAWAEALAKRIREESSSTIILPQVQMNPPLPSPDGGILLNVTLTFTTKVTEASYFKTRAAVISAYHEAVRLREKGFVKEMNLVS